MSLQHFEPAFFVHLMPSFVSSVIISCLWVKFVNDKCDFTKKKKKKKKKTVRQEKSRTRSRRPVKVIKFTLNCTRLQV